MLRRRSGHVRRIKEVTEGGDEREGQDIVIFHHPGSGRQSLWVAFCVGSGGREVPYHGCDGETEDFLLLDGWVDGGRLDDAVR